MINKLSNNNYYIIEIWKKIKSKSKYKDKKYKYTKEDFPDNESQINKDLKKRNKKRNWKSYITENNSKDINIKQKNKNIKKREDILKEKEF